MVFWKLDLLENIGMNCFGMLSRDAGHKRVPAPPHMMTGTIFALMVASCLSSASWRNFGTPPDGDLLAHRGNQCPIKYANVCNHLGRAIGLI
jgi:hypothetical protein